MDINELKSKLVEQSTKMAKNGINILNIEEADYNTYFMYEFSYRQGNVIKWSKQVHYGSVGSETGFLETVDEIIGKVESVRRELEG